MLHSGPFIVAKKNAPTCNVLQLKCAACLCSKATIETSDSMAPRLSQKQFILKMDNLNSGDCNSVDHYFSPVQEHLPHTYSHEKHGYKFGSLFVNRTSGKIFNFPQFSTNTTETLRSVACLESQAYNEGFKIKKYHSDRTEQLRKLGKLQRYYLDQFNQKESSYTTSNGCKTALQSEPWRGGSLLPGFVLPGKCSGHLGDSEHMHNTK